MKLSLIILIILLSVISILSAQYDEKQIMTQEAYQLLARRQYNEAEQMFRIILERWPGDQNSILQLMQIYLQTSQLNKAETLLTENQRSINANTFSEQQILLLIHQGRPEEAYNKTLSYLAQVNYDQNRFRLIASYFEQRSFHDRSSELYSYARQHYNNPDLFTLELANAYLNSRRLEQSAREYLNWLRQSPNNLYFVNNQIKTILTENPELIRVIAESALSTSDTAILELYAGSLVYLKDFTTAFETYKRLPIPRMQRFAEDQYAAVNDSVALMAFSHLRDQSQDIVQKSEYRLKLAQINNRLGNTTAAMAILDSLFIDPTLSQNQYRNRISANYSGRKLLAEMQLKQGIAIDSVLATLDSARRFARGSAELGEANMLITKLLMMNGDYDQAESLLAQVTDPQQLALRDYYKIVLSLFRGEIELADSLMNEYVIMQPGSPWVNDAIQLLMFANSFDASPRTAFLNAYKDFHLYKAATIDSLQSVFAITNEEELLILAAEWAMQMNLKSRALSVLEHSFTDQICLEYAQVLKLRILDDAQSKELIARDFLSQNPNSVFSPGFRSIFSRISSPRPNF